MTDSITLAQVVLYLNLLDLYRDLRALILKGQNVASNMRYLFLKNVTVALQIIFRNYFDLTTKLAHECEPLDCFNGLAQLAYKWKRNHKILSPNGYHIHTHEKCQKYVF